MAYVINENCINCGVCISECPVDAIVEEGGVHKVVEESCIDCGACAPACPVDALQPK